MATNKLEEINHARAACKPNMPSKLLRANLLPHLALISAYRWSSVSPHDRVVTCTNSRVAHRPTSARTSQAAGVIWGASST